MPARILIEEEERQAARLSPSWPTAWKAIGWFSFLLVVVGLDEFLINYYPLAFKSTEWEFATIANSLGTLPMLSMGLAGVLGSFLARGVRWGTVLMVVVFAVFGLTILGLYGLFMTDVPLALKASAGTAAALPIRRGIVRATVLGLVFGVGYLAAAVVSLRSLYRRANP